MLREEPIECLWHGLIWATKVILWCKYREIQAAFAPSVLCVVISNLCLLSSWVFVLFLLGRHPWKSQMMNLQYVNTPQGNGLGGCWTFSCGYPKLLCGPFAFVYHIWGYRKTVATTKSVSSNLSSGLKTPGRWTAQGHAEGIWDQRLKDLSCKSQWLFPPVVDLQQGLANYRHWITPSLCGQGASLQAIYGKDPIRPPQRAVLCTLRVSGFRKLVPCQGKLLPGQPAHSGSPGTSVLGLHCWEAPWRNAAGRKAGNVLQGRDNTENSNLQMIWFTN